MRLLFRKGKLFYIEYNIRLFFFLLFSRFDIICGIDLDTILPCYLASKFRRGLCIYDAHELFSEVPEVVRRPGIQKFWKRVEGFAVSRIRHCYTVSHGLADYFNRKYNRNFEVIRNVPLLDQNTEMTHAAGQPYLLYQGALNEARGLEQLIAAMTAIPLQLKLAGEGDLSEKLRALTAQLELSGKVIFLGKQMPEALIQITAEALIGINLLENKGLSYYFSLANKFFDYVHAGVPVISMNFPEYRQLNKQFEVAVLIDDLNKETLTSAIDSLAHDKDAYFRLQKNCLLAREEWNWQKEEQKLLAFYRALS